MSLRAYFFSNMYISGIHTGIQAGHAITEMFSHYLDRIKVTEGKGNAYAKKSFAMLRSFAKDHKTFVILNGGDHQELQGLFDFISKGAIDKQHTFPYCFFMEPGLKFAMTSVVIILDERMYDDTARAVGKAINKTENSIHSWKTAVPVEMLEEVDARDYNDWELEFLRRKELCPKAS